MLGSLFSGQTLRSLIHAERLEDIEVLNLKGLIETGKLRPVIGRTFAQTEVNEAIRYLSQGSAHGKVVIAVS